MKPIIAIVGRPNVGKSTLFNRLTGTRAALVDDCPGVTRDRHYGDALWNDVEFTVVDTGGYLGADDFASAIRPQVLKAIEDADLIVLMVDGRAGVSPLDREIIDTLRPNTKPVMVAVNKIDGPEQEGMLSDFYSLGLEPIYPISAEHRYGMSDFLDDLIKALPRSPAAPDTGSENDLVKLAVVGRPNVGKSSLINRILGRERLLVSDIPGTTRDAIDTVYHFNGRPYLFIDTAGIRRKGKVSAKIEKFSIIKALRSLERCDVALIVIDAEEGVADQDIGIAGYAEERGCGCVFLLNKWDRVAKDTRTAGRYIEELRERAKFLKYAPALTISALTGQRVTKIFNIIDAVYRQYGTRIGTGQLNRIVESATEKNPPSLYRGRRLKFYYATQVAAKPPSIVCFTNYPEAVHFSYRRYLVNRIRSDTGLDKTPIRLTFRKREGRLTRPRK